MRDAVVRMTEQHVSYALIRLPDGSLGIFTDRDLRTRVVAAGLPVDVPISEVMSAPARTVTADLTAETVLMEMLECGLRHMPVVTSRGEVVGVLEDADLLAASARQSFMLRRSIGLAADAAELQSVGQRVTGHRGRSVPQRDEGVGDERDPVGGHRQPGAQGTGTRPGRSRRCACRRLRVADAGQRRPARSYAVI